MNGLIKIFNKKWYFRLVNKSKENRTRSLMEDYDLENIANHLVVCFTPPASLVYKENLRIYSWFDSYIEFFHYMENFKPEDRCFYEIIFGELPQKPHFDIDINKESFVKLYPNEDMNTIGELLREAIITGCFEILKENNIDLDLSKDVLIYTSHGENKRSYHIVINNKCHNNNKESKLFYELVTNKVKSYTCNKYIEFIDRGVYSSKQQFRIVGSQKLGSNRPKVFCETFLYQGELYEHVYKEDVKDPNVKKVVIMYESLVSFTAGNAFIPLKVLPCKNIQVQKIEQEYVDQCISLLKKKIDHCPFSVREVIGNLILLKRESPSLCPLCNKTDPHEHENPYIFIKDNRVYWSCRRSNKKLFLGFLNRKTNIEFSVKSAFNNLKINGLLEPKKKQSITSANDIPSLPKLDGLYWDPGCIKL